MLLEVSWSATSKYKLQPRGIGITAALAATLNYVGKVINSDIQLVPGVCSIVLVLVSWGSPELTVSHILFKVTS